MQCLMIGGASHVGKSTLAAAWGAKLGWPVISTDRLGRHPGRPWPAQGRAVPPHVAEHHATHDAEALLESNLEHYRAMWPLIETLVTAHLTAPMGRLIVEGSGCWPDQMRQTALPGTAALWLVATDDQIANRIRAESGYAAADPAAQFAIDRFIARSQLFNRRLAERLAALGLPATEVRETERFTDTISRCQDRLFALWARIGWRRGICLRSEDLPFLACFLRCGLLWLSQSGKLWPAGRFVNEWGQL